MIYTISEKHHCHFPMHSSNLTKIEEGEGDDGQQQLVLLCGNNADERHKKRKASRSCRGVSFHPETRIAVVPSMESHSEEEVNAYWYSPGDLIRIQMDIDQTRQCMEQRLPLDDRIQCTRGLEHSVRPARESRKRARSEILQAVVRDHYMERRYGHDCSLASKYSLRSEQDKESAQLFGMIDEEEAMKCYAAASDVGSAAASTKLLVHGGPRKDQHRKVLLDIIKGSLNDSEWDGGIDWCQLSDELRGLAVEEDDEHDFSFFDEEVEGFASSGSIIDETPGKDYQTSFSSRYQGQAMFIQSDMD